MEKLALPNNIDPFVKEILYFDSKEVNTNHKFPFYADGFAGIVFSKSDNKFTIKPQNKVLPDFYLYGQTIIPMTLEVKGAFEVYAFRLFPFAVRTLLGVDSKILNDDCYDLLNVESVDTKSALDELRSVTDKYQTVKILSSYFDELIKSAALDPDHRVILATNLIIKSEGNIKISEIRDRLYITERTLERQFLKNTGVTPMQFAKIIQFHTSAKKITERDYINLSDIGYETGYADQSHFIKNFKRYTGKTPKEFQKQLSI